MTPLLILFCVAVCALATLQQDEPDVDTSRGVPKVSTRFLLVLGGLVVLAAFVAFPSNPAEWSLGNVVLFLAEHTLNPLRVLGVSLLGGGIFYGAVHMLYLSRRR